MEFIRLYALIGSGIAMGIGSIGAAVGEGMVAMKALQAVGRQPKASSRIIRMMIIAQAVTETSAIFSLVVSMLLLFSVPSEGSLSKGIALLVAGVTMGLGSIGAGFGSGLPGRSAIEGVGNNPENADALTINMIIGQAVTQTSAIFSMTIALTLVMLNPEDELTKVYSLLGAGLAMGLGAIGPGIGTGLVAARATEALSKDGANLNLLTRTMIIGQAVTETADIYAIVVSLILIYVV